MLALIWRGGLLRDNRSLLYMAPLLPPPPAALLLFFFLCLSLCLSLVGHADVICQWGVGFFSEEGPLLCDMTCVYA